MKRVTALLWLALSLASLQAELPTRDLADFQIGINCHQYYVENLPLLSDLGLKSGRIDVLWREVTDDKANLMSEAPTLRRINEAPLALSQTLAILCYGHPIYQAMGRPTEPAAIEAFSRFCSEAAGVLRTRTRFFEIWNEWNVVGMGDAPLSEGKGTPEDYVRLLKSSYHAVKKAIPDSLVLGGAMGGIGEHDDYLTRALKAGLLDYCDGLSIHPYFYGVKTPKARLPENAIRERLNKLKGWLSDYPKGDVMPLYVTEIGWPTLDTPEGVTCAEQAKWLTRSLFIFACYPNVKGVWIYELRDGKNDPSDREANFGLVRWNGKPKPAYDCMRDTISLFSKHQTISHLKLSDKDLAAVVLSAKAGKKSVAVWAIYPETAYKVRIDQGSRTDTPKRIGRLQYPDGPVPVDQDGWFTVDDHPVLVTGVDEDFELLHKKQ